MKITKEHFKHGIRILKNTKLNTKYHRYEGDPRIVCRKIVKANWNGVFFSSGTRHHNNFNMRVFGLCTESLLYMNYENEVIKTLEYALKVYKHYNKLTNSIDQNHKPVELFGYSCDTLPYLIRSIRLAKSGHLFAEYKDFLQEKIEEYYKEVWDEKKLAVYEHKPFSSFKHHLELKSSFYDNVAVALLAKELRFLKDKYKISFYNPFEKWNFKKTLKDRFWVGNYFLDDISDQYYLSADANLFPYFFNIFEDPELVNSSINMLIKEKLDYPVPCKTLGKKIAEKENPILSYFAENFHVNTCHTLLGMVELKVLLDYNSVLARKYIDVFLEMIENYQNFLEAFDASGKPYNSKFYSSDESVLWASIFYHVLEEYHKPFRRKFEFERRLGKWD